MDPNAGNSGAPPRQKLPVKPKPKAETPAKPVEPAPAPKPPPDDDELDMGDLKNPFRKK